MLSSNVNMKPGTNLSRRSSIFQCNRHQIDWTSNTNICAISRKRTSALFFEEAYSPCGRCRPSPPEKKKKKKEKKKNYPSFTPFKNWREDTTLVFITSILKSLLILVIWLALIGAIYSQETPFSSKLHLSPTQWNWKTTQFCKFLKTSSLLDKKSICTD